MAIFLVLGGTGVTGGRVARRLRDAGHTARAAARTGGDVRVDLADPATWAPALDGAAGAYLIEPEPGAANAGRLPAFAAAAVDAGVRRLALLTSGGAGAPGHPMYPAERAVRDSGAAWTILRPTWFAQNFGEGIWRGGVLSGTLRLPAGDGRTPFLDAADIAEIAAAALTGDGHAGRAYDLSGPRALTMAEAVDVIARATGRAIRYTAADPAEFAAEQAAAGVPADVVRLLGWIYGSIRDGAAAALTDGVERALGRPATPFADYVAQAAREGRWR